MCKIKTIELLDESLIKQSRDNFKYQEDLTKHLDKPVDEFDQERLNEIVLWKVNRYVNFDTESINLINEIDIADTVINEEKTRKILILLLKTKGVRLPMASTILRFKNPNVYQIIDQRVYRIICNSHFNPNYVSTNDKSINNQIDIYLEYLEKLKKECAEKNISFNQADRILYEADKIMNRNIKIKY